MVDSNIARLYREYPFLESIVPQAKAHEVRVERFDVNFANERNLRWEPTYHTPIYLLDKHGDAVDGVGHFKNRTWWRLTLDILGALLQAPRFELVNEALKRMGADADRVHYAVQILDGGSFFKKNVVLYKLPAGFNNAGEWYRSLELESGRRHPVFRFRLPDIAV